MIALGGQDADLAVAALPRGVVELAGAWRRLLDHRVEPTLAGRPVGPAPDLTGDERAAIVDEVTLPLRLEPDWPPPAAPVPVGDGWVHDETVDDDAPVLGALLASHGRHGPERVAAEAQALRLPINPFRHPDAVPPVAGLAAPVDGASNDGDAAPTAAGRTVVDLTAHWAGPLATRLLAERGAEVIKVDPMCRPDGFRKRAALYDHLNGSKRIVDLDLRVDADRAEFEALLRRADLVVESFSRRVMANLGYDPARLAAVGSTASTLAVRAFPIGGSDWDRVGYGPGVHAAMGLGFTGPGSAAGSGPERTGRPTPAPVAYPDVIAGIAAAAHGLRLLDRPGRYREITLAAAVAPLPGLRSGPGPIGPIDSNPDQP